MKYESITEESIGARIRWPAALSATVKRQSSLGLESAADTTIEGCRIQELVPNRIMIPIEGEKVDGTWMRGICPEWVRPGHAGDVPT